MRLSPPLPRGLIVGLSVPLTWLAATTANASDMEFSLQVRSAAQRVSATQTEEQPSSEKPRPRAMFVSEPGEKLVVSWQATNTGKDETFKDVLIHCFVVAEKEAGQSDVPTLEDPVEESALTMDFKPGGTAAGEFSLTVDKPGAYLLRVETQNMLDTHGHEHYTALDLVRK